MPLLVSEVLLHENKTTHVTKCYPGEYWTPGPLISPFWINLAFAYTTETLSSLYSQKSSGAQKGSVGLGIGGPGIQ